MNHAEEFWAKVAIPDGEDEVVVRLCWPWTGGKNADGYGVLRWRGKTVYAHHLGHDLFFGPCEKGLVRRHRCGNRPCCNPFHLRSGTQLENVQEAMAMGRLGRLTPLEVLALRARRAAGESSTSLGREFGIHPGRVRHICAARPDSWRHVGTC